MAKARPKKKVALRKSKIVGHGSNLIQANKLANRSLGEVLGPQNNMELVEVDERVAKEVNLILKQRGFKEFQGP